MARDPKYDVLFEPVKIGPKTLRNRFYQVPHCIGAGSEKPGFQAYHRGIKAEGGWAACCTEYCSIHPESDDTMRVSARIWDDGDVQNLAAMCDRLHHFGALAGIELWYGGPHAPCMETRDTPRGPSQIASEFESNIYPRYMDRDDIRLVQQYYVDAAIRAREAGFDIIYVYGAHSYLPLQFLSPWANKRTDEYGGSFENRARFWKESLEKVREAVGDDCAIASRFAVDTLYGPAGVELEKDGIRFVEHVDHLVDLWDLTVGDIAEWGQNAGPSRFFEENHEKPYTGRIKPGNHTDKPVVGVGRITNPDTMVAIIQSGQFDIIGAARPSISDPFLPKKIEEGRLDDIRECIGCNQCISRWEIGGPPMVCTQNATAGEEYRRGWHPERFEPASNANRPVLVVGAGPSGMECAIVLAKRSFEAVHLVDAAPTVGGRLCWVRRLPTLGDWGRIVDWRLVQLQKLEAVEVICNRRLSIEDVLDYGAELVVVATGSRWRGDGVQPYRREPITGADSSVAHVLTPEQVMLEGKRPPGRRVVVYDTDGYYVAPGVAELLAAEGFEVHLVTTFPVVSPDSDATLEGEMLRRHLHGAGIEAHRCVTLHSVTKEGVSGGDEFDEPWSLESDGVVLVTQQEPEDALYRDLVADPGRLEAAGIEHVYRIGDAVAPRPLSEAVFDGHRLAREIDRPDPSQPAAYLRERIELRRR